MCSPCGRSLHPTQLTLAELSGPVGQPSLQTELWVYQMHQCWEPRGGRSLNVCRLLNRYYSEQSCLQDSGHRSKKVHVEEEVLGSVYIITPCFSLVFNAVEKMKPLFPGLEQQHRHLAACQSFQTGKNFAYCHHFCKVVFLFHSSF